MINKDDRIAIDKETIDLMINNMSYSIPYTEDDLKKAYYEGQRTMLYKLEQMLVGHMTGEGFKGVVTEEDLGKLLEEVLDDSE